MATKSRFFPPGRSMLSFLPPARIMGFQRLGAAGVSSLFFLEVPCCVSGNYHQTGGHALVLTGVLTLLSSLTIIMMLTSAMSTEFSWHNFKRERECVCVCEINFPRLDFGANRPLLEVALVVAVALGVVVALAVSCSTEICVEQASFLVWCFLQPSHQASVPMSSRKKATEASMQAHWRI